MMTFGAISLIPQDVSLFYITSCLGGKEKKNWNKYIFIYKA